jgi:hypothetical protein
MWNSNESQKLRRTVIGKYDFSGENYNQGVDQHPGTRDPRTGLKRTFGRSETQNGAVWIRFRKVKEKRKDYKEHPYWYGKGTTHSQL